MSYKVNSIGSSPFSITNDHDTPELRVFIFTLASGTVNLPSAVGFKYARLNIKKRNASAGTVTIQPSLSQLINNASSYSLTSDNQYVEIVSDQTQWHIVANN